ncbi:LysE family translocator [Marinicella sp. W31]|uniref:LysE family translocator n=1 Tax=Marinicella sp. W31 TaxID=3023713 RepID=UPI003756867C
MTDYLAFTVTAIILALTPGPDILLVVATAARNGFKQAIRFTMGLASGVIVHTLLIIFGVSALIASSPMMVKLIGLFGAGYLFYLAARIFMAMRQQAESVENSKNIEGSYYWRGVIMNISNPKVLLFFLALFPQFARLDAPGYQMRILILGGIFQLVTIGVFGGMAWLTAKSSAHWMSHGRYRHIMDWVNVAVFVIIGVLLLLNSLR